MSYNVSQSGPVSPLTGSGQACLINLSNSPMQGPKRVINRSINGQAKGPSAGCPGPVNNPLLTPLTRLLTLLPLLTLLTTYAIVGGLESQF